MAVFLVTWDLNQAPNYDDARAKFISHLQTYPHIKDDGLDSVWFISTTSSADEICEFLHKKMDNNDCLIVTKLNDGEHQGWLAKATWDWINART